LVWLLNVGNNPMNPVEIADVSLKNNYFWVTFIHDEISYKVNDFRTTCNDRNVKQIYAFGALITKKSIG
jgi:hypothetical protein